MASTPFALAIEKLVMQIVQWFYEQSNKGEMTAMSTQVTLTQFIIEQQHTMPGVSGDFTSLLNDIVRF